MRIKSILLLFAILISTNTYSQTLDSSFYEWTVFEIKADGINNKKCYIIKIYYISIQNSRTYRYNDLTEWQFHPFDAKHNCQ